MLHQKTFKIGQRVYYRGGWGQDAQRLTTITSEGTKNDQTVYGNDLGHWGYADQYTAAPEGEKA